jgi:hypothetical protein
MTVIFKPTANEVTINSTANSVVSATNIGQGCLLRILNIDAANTINFQYSNGTQYASMTVANGESIVVWKNNTDLLVTDGSMLAVPISYKAL